MLTGHPMPLDAYRRLIDLDRPFTPTAPPAAPQTFQDLTRDLLGLLATDPAAGRLGVTAGQVRSAAGTGQARALLRALLTVRGPGPLPAHAVPLLDALLAGERTQRRSIDVGALPTIAEQNPGTGYPAAAATVLWRGDITTLRADAIVNAANSALLGCFQPTHRCIDNVIHATAGPRLRDDCDTIVTTQDAPELTGSAKITRGYHLPARYVLHTVGPVVDGPLQLRHEAALAAAYRSCLDLAAAAGRIRTVAFCSISTGVFGYPKPPAARVALAAVGAWLDEHPGRLDRVVFDVFTADDLHLYRQALTEWSPAQ
jgi:O-acetyl-ADP-ribose deacetylase (regulator of RNase III)